MGPGSAQSFSAPKSGIVSNDAPSSCSTSPTIHNIVVVTTKNTSYTAQTAAHGLSELFKAQLPGSGQHVFTCDVADYSDLTNALRESLALRQWLLKLLDYADGSNLSSEKSKDPTGLRSGGVAETSDAQHATNKIIFVACGHGIAVLHCALAIDSKDKHTNRSLLTQTELLLHLNEFSHVSGQIQIRSLSLRSERTLEPGCTIHGTATIANDPYGTDSDEIWRGPPFKNTDIFSKYNRAELQSVTTTSYRYCAVHITAFRLVLCEPKSFGYVEVGAFFQRGTFASRGLSSHTFNQEFNQEASLTSADESPSAPNNSSTTVNSLGEKAGATAGSTSSSGPLKPPPHVDSNKASDFTRCHSRQKPGRLRRSESCGIEKPKNRQLTCRHRTWQILATTLGHGSSEFLVMCHPSSNGSSGLQLSQDKAQPSKATKSAGQKRPYPNNDDDDDGDQSSSKRVLTGMDPEHAKPREQIFPCPYYLISPERHPSCWDKRWLPGNIRKLKEHLYKAHQRVLCTECQMTFKDRPSMQGHTHRASCERDYIEGFDYEQRAQLKRKDKIRNIPAQAYWNEVFGILFPGRIIPLLPSHEALFTASQVEQMLRRHHDDLHNGLMMHAFLASLYSPPVLDMIESVFTATQPAVPITHFERATQQTQQPTRATLRGTGNVSGSVPRSAPSLVQLTLGREVRDNRSTPPTDGPSFTPFDMESSTGDLETVIYDPAAGSMLPHSPGALQFHSEERRDRITRGEALLPDNDNSDVPRHSASLLGPYAGRNMPSPSSGFESNQSSSPLFGPVPSSRGNGSSQGYTSASSQIERDEDPFLFGGFLTEALQDQGSHESGTNSLSKHPSNASGKGKGKAVMQ